MKEKTRNIALAWVVILIIVAIVFAIRKDDISLHPAPAYCHTFKTQREAQEVFNSSRYHYHNLDGDQDLIACESLP